MRLSLADTKLSDSFPRSCSLKNLYDCATAQKKRTRVSNPCPVLCLIGYVKIPKFFLLCILEVIFLARLTNE